MRSRAVHNFAVKAVTLLLALALGAAPVAGKDRPACGMSAPGSKAAPTHTCCPASQVTVQQQACATAPEADDCGDRDAPCGDRSRPDCCSRGCGACCVASARITIHSAAAAPQG